MLWIEFKDSYLEWLSVHGGDHHVAKAREVLGRFTRYMDPVELSSIDRQVLHHYLARRKKDPGRRKEDPISPVTLNGDITYLNMIFAYLKDELGLREAGLSTDWRVPRLKRVKVPKRKPRGLSREVVDKVFAACEFAKRPMIEGVSPCIWWRTFFYLALITGIRVRGLLGIPRPSEAELADNELFLSAELNKSGADQIFYIPDLMVTLIRQLPCQPGEVMLDWPNKKNCFYSTLRRFQTQAGFKIGEFATPHNFRKTLATWMIKGGAPITMVQRQLGHSTPTVTQNYIGDVSDEQKQAINNIGVPACFAGRT